MQLEDLRKLDRIHPYPAKFTVDLAIDNISKYTKENDFVYDPFLGSGTTELAAKFLKRNSCGTDINYIAILISKFKTMNVTQDNLNNLRQFINEFKLEYREKSQEVEKFYYKSIEHWFCDDSIKILSFIKNKISDLSDETEMTFCKLVMSAIINNASNQESDTRYAAVYKPKLNIEYVANMFIKKFESSLEIVSASLDVLNNTNICNSLLLNSKRSSEVIKKNSIDMILTSPPYPNTYDYYLYHKHRMNWLDYDVNYSMSEEIGSRREFSSLKKPKEKFDDDMYEILYEANKLLKVGGYAVIVMGDGRIRGEDYEAKSNVERICNRLNWRTVDYSFTLLDQTSRSFQKAYRTKGKKEHILVFEKGDKK